jgi:hypothetical protein
MIPASGIEFYEMVKNNNSLDRKYRLLKKIIRSLEIL